VRPRTRGRTAASRTTAPATKRSAPIPAAPKVAKAVVASAAPACSEAQLAKMHPGPMSRGANPETASEGCCSAALRRCLGIRAIALDRPARVALINPACQSTITTPTSPAGKTVASTKQEHSLARGPPTRTRRLLSRMQPRTRTRARVRSRCEVTRHRPHRLVAASVPQLRRRRTRRRTTAAATRAMEDGL
jgi:hypothetical protein